MRKLKLFVILISALLIALPAFCASREEWELAELLAQPQGRSRVSGNSVLFTIWYQDNSNVIDDYAQLGLSGSTAEYSFNLYENGTIVAATRFASSDGSIDTTATAYDTIGELVEAINADTSGYWHASLGPDAYEDMPCDYMMNKNVTLTDTTDENEFTADPLWDTNVPESDAPEMRLSVDSARGMTCGVKSETSARIRLKFIEESTTADLLPHWIEVWSGDDIIYRRGFTAAESCTRDEGNAEIASGSANIRGQGDSSTPNTVNLAEGHKGVGGAVDENLCVFTKWNSTATMQADYGAPVTGNLSIIYDIVKP